MNAPEELLIRISDLAKKAHHAKQLNDKGKVLRLVAEANKLLEKVVHLTKQEREK